MRTIVFLVGILFLAPGVAQAGGGPIVGPIVGPGKAPVLQELCLSCVSSGGGFPVNEKPYVVEWNSPENIVVEPKLIFSNPVWEPSKTVTDDPALVFVSPAPSEHVDIYVDGPFADQVKVLSFRWKDSKKCYDFTHLREHKEFKEIPCE